MLLVQKMNDAIIITYRMSYEHPVAIVSHLSSSQDNYMMVPGMVGFWHVILLSIIK